MVFIEGLKERFSLLCWFIQGCHQKRFLIKNKFSKDNIMISSFADFRISDLIDKLPPLLSNLDAQSIRNVENALEVNFMLHNKGVVADKRTYLSKEQIEEYNKFGNSDKFLLARKYGIDCKNVLPETFLFHHGLKNADRKIKDYIKNKIFLDCGAFMGDSALVLLEYHPGKIYSFDISALNIKAYRDTLKNNGVPESLAELLPYGIGAENKTVRFADGLSGDTSLSQPGDSEVQIITLDSFTADRPTVGFVKADIEGAGLDMAKGMANLLRRDRPVLSLAMYHTPEEFFEIKPFIESLDLDYKFEVLSFSDGIYGELTLMAYPKELE